MKTIISISTLVLVLSSCGGNTLCDCNNAGAEISKLNQEVILGDRSQTTIDKINNLKTERDEICKDFKMMSEEELLKAVSECEELDIDTGL